MAEISTIPRGTDLDPDLEAGTTVGEYQIEGKLGQGGFGAVFKAVHPLIGKVVAIKVLSQRFSVDKEMVSRFVAEARAVNQIRHRNIIDIFSFGQLPDRRQYYVMDFVEGETLDHRIEQGRLTLPEAIPILLAIARALDAAHAKGIAHRDLKAENIFLGTDSDGSVFPKLLDFGIAKLMGPDSVIAHKTATGAPMGTPYYMSPEQTRGRDVDHRTDLYAFGVLIYLMLTGKYPLDGEDYMTILMRQVNDEPAPASSHVPELPERVDHIIAWLMCKTPAERPPDLQTAVRALEEVAGVQAPPGARSAPIQIPAAITSKLAAPVPATISGLSGLSGLKMQLDEPKPAPKRGWLVPGIVGVVLAAAAVVVVVVVTSKSGDAGSPLVVVMPDAQPAAVVDAAPQVVAIDARAAFVTITLEGAPPNTEVRVGGQVYGTAPKLQLPYGEQELMLVLGADGYLPLSIPITPNQDQLHPATLKLKSGKPPKPPTGKGSGSAGGGSAGSGNSGNTGSGSAGSGEPTDEIMTFPK